MRAAALALALLALAATAGAAPRAISLPLSLSAAPAGAAAAAGARRRLLLRNASLPLHGAVKDFGYFYAALYLGTPPRRFSVIVDTGSTMTYVPCASCGAGCGPNHQDAAFDPARSATAKPVACGGGACRCGAPTCGCSAGGQCEYARAYAEQSSSSGVLLEDLLALHDGAPGAPVVFGCETRETGEIFRQRADGLLGLGDSDASVVNQLAGAGEIADAFTLCLGGVEGGGVLVLGDAAGTPAGAAAAAAPLAYTPLLRSPSHPFYYTVRLEALAVGGAPLPVDPEEYAVGYGAVLDSGTTFTYLPTAAYTALAAAVEAAALGAGLARVRGPDPAYEDVCFGGAPDHGDAAGLAAAFPSLELRLGGGAALAVGPLNYLFVHTFGSGKYCLGVFDNGAAGTLLGGITFRDVMVHYDRAGRRVGLGRAACRALGAAARPPCAAFAGAGGGGGGELAALRAVADGDCAPAGAADAALAAVAPPAVAAAEAAEPARDYDEEEDFGDEVIEEEEAVAAAPPFLEEEEEELATQGAAVAAAADAAPPARGVRLSPVTIGALAAAGAAAVLGVAVVALLARPGAREALRARLGAGRYRPLDEERGGAAGGGGGGGGGGEAAALLPAAKAAAAAAAPLPAALSPLPPVRVLPPLGGGASGGAALAARAGGLGAPKLVQRTNSAGAAAAAELAAELAAEAAAARAAPPASSGRSTPPHTPGRPAAP
jgi:hypothetical protein